MLQDGVDSRQYPKRAAQGNSLGFPNRTWLLWLAICALLVTFAFAYVDVPMARRVAGILGPTQALATGLSSAVLLGIESAVALALIIMRGIRGELSRFRQATLLASLTSICAYAVNDSTLKFLFGVPPPKAVLEGAQHAFKLLGGSPGSSFPSGHMVLAGAFAGVFMRMYRSSVAPLSALLLLAAVLLIVGDWHFLSDVIAGTFLGISAGYLAGEIWLARPR